MFPRLALTGGFGSESTSLSELLKSPYAVMEGALLTPIFGWGKNRAALKAKKAAYEAEVHSYETVSYTHLDVYKRQGPVSCQS